MTLIRNLTAAVLLFGAIPVSAQTFTEWQDPAVNALNRLPMRATSFAYGSPEAAAAGEKCRSMRYLSLEGTWRFAWVASADERPTDFYRTDYQDSHWGTMPVPGMWELNGYGDPQYLNVGYPWREQYRNNPPLVPTRGNHVGSYRREVEIPASWSGEQVIAHFGSATSNLYLWVNGRFVGYSEDSKLEAEFDITKFVKPGRNLFAMQVFRWSDGTYLEDQDFFRLSGIARECYLYTRDRRHIADIHLDASLTENYTHGTLEVTLTLPAAAKGCRAEVALRDSAGASVATAEVPVTKSLHRLTLDAGKVAPWSAECPNLYEVTTTLRDARGGVIEVIPLRTGFREVKIAGGQLLVNGAPILVKGANRHEMDPDGGYVVSRERMEQDVRILKENNFNALRTCHYPDDPYLYELCDRYGLYVVAEANVESHGMGYGEESLAKNPAFRQAHVERNERNVERNRNHPSVIVWSLGNEAGDGANFAAAYARVKEADPSRPVQYEQAIYSPSTANTDIICPMYRDLEGCRKLLEEHPAKPLIQCEYAHAMGNSMGGFAEYWELIRSEPRYQGGFIWDFVDQSLRKRGRGGVMIYGYGGDWNPYDASDQNFCDNGLISPDRVPNPHMHEVRYCQQSVWATLGADHRTLELYNEYFFRSLENYRLEWELLRDGEPFASGTLAELTTAPQQRTTHTLGYDPATLPATGELLLNVRIRIKRAEPGLAAGHVAAYNQFTLREHAAAKPTVREAMADRHTSLGALTVDDSDRNHLIVESPLVRIDFARRSGLIVRYEVEGRPLLDVGAALEPNFWRAPTDNDFGAGLQRKNRVWEDPGMKLSALEHRTEEGIASITATYTLERVGGTLRMEYRINNAGEIIVSQHLRPGARTDIPHLMRFGLRMRMPAQYDRIDYYGRGPWENYVDRKSGALIGRYRQLVCEQFYPYIRPQESGTKSDVRRWRQHDLAGRGIELTAAEPFFASALHYAQEALDEGVEKRQGHSQEVTPERAVWLTMDGAQYGLACINSWGEPPLEQYRLPYGEMMFEVKITPVKPR